MKESAVPLESLLIRSRLKHYTMALAVVWTSGLALSLALSIKEAHRDTQGFAYNKAVSHFNKDQALRFWGTRHGGVYVPTTEQTQPNPYLTEVRERDIETPLGKSLTLMNPAYIVRQMNEWFADLYGAVGHITSLKPLRPANSPDDWERAALISFHEGTKEISQFSIIDGKPHLRFMRPMFVKRGCLKCHGHQGYKEGDVRGGVSVSVPLAPFLAVQDRRITTSVLTTVILWVFGLVGIGIGWRQIRKSDDDRNSAIESLRLAHDQLKTKNEQLDHEIEERKQIQKTLSKSQRRYRELWDFAPAAYHVLDVEGTITRVNRTELDMLGYTKKEMLGKPIFDFVLPEQRDDAKERFRRKLTGDKIIKHDDRIYIKKDGTKVNVSIDDVLERNEDGEVVGVRTTMVDVTDLKRAQKELRRLSSQILDVQENERKSIARELHDSIGQSLAAIKFKLEHVINQLHETRIEAAKNSLEALIPLVLNASKEVRQIHTDLRPSVLDDLGIVSTISWFCREFEQLYPNIQVDRESNIEEGEIPESLKVVIFRILQEAMNNAAKYGNPNLLRISLKKEDSQLTLTVQDNGLGFDPERVQIRRSLTGGFGITSMKERAENSGGSFSIESQKGLGTIIQTTWSVTLR